MMTVDRLDRLLRQAKQHFHQAGEASARGDREAARRFMLKAAENLFLAAGHSRGRLRETRKTLAEELLAEAEALRQPSRRAPPDGRNGPTSSHPLQVDGEKGEKNWLVYDRPEITFDNVAGLEDVKQQIRLKLLYPFTHADLAAQYGVEPGGGILLYGPPGTGKTLIARAVAGEIEAAFFAIVPSQIMSQWVGVAEKNIASLFAEANTYPVSVIFLDEMESLAPRRRTSGSTVMQRVVPQLLAELDGFRKRENALLFIGATNEPWAIDNAMLRPGRLDRLIYVPPPDQHARQRILELHLKGISLAKDVSLAAVADRTAGFSGADMAALARRVRERVFLEAIDSAPRPIAMSDFEAVLGEMQPSVSEKELRKFEQFAAS